MASPSGLPARRVLTKIFIARSASKENDRQPMDAMTHTTNSMNSLRCSESPRTLLLLGALVFLLASHIAVVQASCSDVHIIFARGSGQLPGLGVYGTPFVEEMQSNLDKKNVSSYAVDYLADLTQLSAGSGATDMTKNVVAVAAECPDTVFVLGGYSQGASVVTISIGIDTRWGKGEVIPKDLAPRIKAVVTFGNPLSFDGETIAGSSPLYASKAIEVCNSGDPVCGDGVNVLSHLMYAKDDLVKGAADKATEMVKSFSDKLADGLSFADFF